MSFEPYVPNAGPRRSKAQAGRASVAKSGTCNFHVSDLRDPEVGINDTATVLIDRATGRVGVRKPGGDGYVTLRVVWAKNRRSGHVHIGGPMRQLGHEPKARSGVYEVMKKHGMLIVQFGDQKGKGTSKD